MKKLSEFDIVNIIIIVFNLLTTLKNSFFGLVSTFSIFILGFNLFMTIRSIQNYGKSTANTICLVLEIITAFLIVITIF